MDARLPFRQCLPGPILSVLWAGQVRVANLEDAAGHVGEVLRRVKKQYLTRAYKVKDW